MERNATDLPENYALKHRHRVYYLNCCNYCFSSENLLKCASCKCVSYCSINHQSEDWLFHRPTCLALKKIKSLVPFPENCSADAFFNYRASIIAFLMHLRNFEHPSQLTEYERQICLIPWVCAVCFKKPSKNFLCICCQSVIYCSLEHMENDKSKHGMICWTWKLCRIFSSLRYENGYKVNVKHSVYQPIRRNLRHWPSDKLELIKLVQNEAILDKGLEIFVRMNIFIDPYIPGAIIIDALEKAGIIKKRFLMTRSFHQRKNNQRKSSNSHKTNRSSAFFKKKSTLTIHFAIADDYEMEFEWNKIAQLLTDWIININKVNIVVTSPILKDCVVPSFENLEDTIRVSTHQKSYHEVQDLPAPDVIVMFECDRAFEVQYHLQVRNKDIKDALFKYSDIPVILCDGHDKILTKIFQFLSQFRDLKCLVPITLNKFTDINFFRIWNNSGMDIYTRNNTFLVFTKC